MKTKRDKKRVAVIGTVGLPANYGGFETLAHHLVDQLHDEYEMNIYCSKKRYKKEERVKQYNGARLTYIPFDANGSQSIIYDALSMMHAIFFSDVLLILGVSGAWFLPFVRLFTRKRIIISIDGIEWRRNKWNKWAKRFLRWSEKIAVRFSHIDISDNESIQDYTAKSYSSLSMIIEYGADHVQKHKPGKEDLEKYAFLKDQYAIKVCRIEPENNVEMVLEAFSQTPEKQIVFIGNWENSSYGSSLKKKFNEYANIHILDPIYDPELLGKLRGNASLYIHGHSAGGTNPSLIEAMYLGLPVFSFGVSYNKTTTEGAAKYFSTQEDLCKLLSDQDLNLRELASNMKEIANRRYTWEVIAKKYQYMFELVYKLKKKRSLKNEFSFLNRKRLLKNEVAHLEYCNHFYQTESRYKKNNMLVDVNTSNHIRA